MGSGVGRYGGIGDDDGYGAPGPGVDGVGSEIIGSGVIGSGVIGAGMIEPQDPDELGVRGSDVIVGQVIGVEQPEAAGSAEADAADSDPQQPGFTEWTAASRTGSITVRTSDQGLPLGISVDPAELQRDPRALAAEVLRLCKQAANRAALARRAEFEEAGVPADTLRSMGLPTPEEVARAELLEEDEYETEPESWLRST